VDLCAAPGSWCQVLSRKLFANAERPEDVRIVAVDLQEMAPIEGVTCIAGDITSFETVMQVLDEFRQGDETRLAELVVCDGAPDVTGMHDIDEYIQAQLVLSAISFALLLLRPGGTFVAKIFRGKDITLIYAQLKLFFADVYCAKPKSSRNTSVEAFVVARGFRPPADLDTTRFTTLRVGGESDDGLTRGGSERLVVPFVACGDLCGYDADQNYDLKPLQQLQPPGARALPDDVPRAATEADASGYVYHEPTQKPTTPAYRAYLEAQTRTGTLDGSWAGAGAGAGGAGAASAGAGAGGGARELREREAAAAAAIGDEGMRRRGAPAEEPRPEQQQQQRRSEQDEFVERQRAKAAALFEAALWELADEEAGEAGLDSGLASLQASATDQLSPEEQAIVHAATAARPERAGATEAQLAAAMERTELERTAQAQAAQAAQAAQWDDWEEEWEAEDLAAVQDILKG